MLIVATAATFLTATRALKGMSTNQFLCINDWGFVLKERNWGATTIQGPGGFFSREYHILHQPNLQDSPESGKSLLSLLMQAGVSLKMCDTGRPGQDGPAEKIGGCEPQ